MLRTFRRNIQTKRKVLAFSKLITSQLNQKLFQQAKSSIQSAKDLIVSVTDVPLKTHLLCLILNSEASLWHHQKNSAQALMLLKQTIQMEKGNPVSEARSYLNQSVILSDTGEHQQALDAAKKANSVLGGKGLLMPERPERQTIRELYVISTLNMARECQKLDRPAQALDVYARGCQAARTWLGQKHQLTQILKNSVLRLQKASEKQGQHSCNNRLPRFRISRGRSNQSISNIVAKQQSQQVTLNAKGRADDILSIYQPKFRSTTVKTRKQAYVETDQMSQIERIKSLYRPLGESSSKKTRTEESTYTRREKSQSFY